MNKEIIIYTKRYRYQRDPITRKRPCYTEWQCELDGVIKFRTTAGQGISKKQFINLCLVRLGDFPVKQIATEYINLAFKAQRI